MIAYYKLAMSRYATFEGRSRRSEFGWYNLVVFLISLAATILDTVLGLSAGGYGVFAMIVLAVHLLPSIAVAVRRLHDVGRSGWWYLLVLVPLVNLLMVLYLLFADGNSGANEYGPDPKAAQLQ